MGCDASRCDKISTPKGIFIVTPSLEGLPAKANDAPKVVVDITNSAADYNNPNSESIKQKKVEEETGGIGLILVTDHLLQKLQPKN